MPSIVSRRDWLKTGGALVVGFSLGVRAGRAQGAEPAKPLDPKEVDSFLAIHGDGSVTVYCGKVDVGTGLRIAVRQMAAEELGIPVDRIKLVEGDTGLSPDQGGTGGSTGLTRGGSEVRQAAATARQALLRMAAEKLNRPADELTIADGEVRPISGGAGLTLAALMGERRFDLKVDSKAPLRPAAQYQVIGKPLARPDVPGKCTARGNYIQDFSLAGMLHGRVVRPPAVGAKLLSVDESSIRGIPDVRVVRIENFLGVVSPDEWAAVRAARELKANWSEGESLPGNEELERYLRESPVERDQTAPENVSASVIFAPPIKHLSATYFWPNQSHASLGPSCAIADMRPDGLTVWSSSQGTHGLRISFAKLFSLPAEKVRVIYLEGAGSYGGNGNDDAAADAVLLSKAVGRPVRVQWMRHDEHGWDPKGPQQLLDVKASLSDDGRIIDWNTQMWLPAARPGTRPFLGIDAAGIAQPHGQNAGSVSQNGDPPYAVASPAVVTVHWIKETPLRISNLRAPGKIANVFAVESFTDELAAAAKADPVAFRVRGLEERGNDPRALAVVKRAAEMIGWQPRPSPNPKAAEGGMLVGRGFAYMRYKQAENYVAMAMEVTVERSTGRVAVRRVVCAHDCGLVVNPDALRNQIEGCIVQTLSRTLHEEVKFDRSRVTSLDWASYPILRFPEAPAVEVALLDHPELPLMGAGEAATAPVAAALGNAIFDATGVRLRTVPFTAARVKAALG
ncbi:MAG TPA: molybdopterin cofactor-binding domain-containing protein [Bryobacteraceae bacterium]|nr:molybdopterin cofactor-binding domain-containing protein [Bryobacteraceae bacterium]